MSAETTEKPLHVPPDEIESMRAIIRKQGLKVRAGSQGVINNAKIMFYMVPVIQMWTKEKRRYMILSFEAGWRFDTIEERDRVLDALTTP